MAATSSGAEVVGVWPKCGVVVWRASTMVWMMERDQHRRSHLFTVRLWAEDLGDGRAEWRGKVERVTSGEAFYFRDWSTLVSLLITMLPDVQVAQDPDKPVSTSSDEDASPSV